MGLLTVDPRTVTAASSTLRSAADHGMPALARAIVDDLHAGLAGDSDGTEDFLTAVPLLVGAVCAAVETTATELDAAANGYTRTDWLVRVALAGPR